MSERVIPTTEGPWWADVDGERRVLEVWPHADHDTLRFSPRRGVVWSVDDERLVEGLEGYDLSDGERIPSVEWVEPASSPDYVATLRAERDGWQRTAAEFHRNAEFYRGIVTQIGAPFPDAYVSDDGTVQEDVLALKVPEIVEQLRAERDALIAEGARLREKHVADLAIVRAYADSVALPATKTGTPSEPSRWFPAGVTFADDLRDLLDGIAATQEGS